MITFRDFLNENANSKSRTDKWTLDQIKNAKYSSSFMDDREEVCIKGKSYVKIGKNKWQYFSTNPHVIGGTCTDKDIYEMMHESVKNDDKIVFHNYKELKEYCRDPNNPLDRVVLGKEITSLRGLFYKSSRTNEQFDGISEWDVSNVEDMYGMFAEARNFNQPLNNWDVSNVEDMYGMFCNAKNFNQSLDKWDVSNVWDMNGMFYGAKSFNQPLNKWDVSSVEDMEDMFYGAKSFNQPLNKWDISRVENMEDMFNGSKLEKEHNLPNWYR